MVMSVDVNRLSTDIRKRRQSMWHLAIIILLIVNINIKPVYRVLYDVDGPT